jgi:hypothetical protein
MSKKLESKLADSVRQAKQQNETAATAAATPAAAKPASPAKLDANKKFASQADQAPKPSLDSPWENLYPSRIWPD